MKKQALIIAAVALLTCTATAQKLSIYTTSVGFEEYVSIASTGTQLASVVGDAGNQTIAMPFDFEFGEHTIAQGSSLLVRADGHVLLDITSVSSGYLQNGYDKGYRYYQNDYYHYYAIVPFLLQDGQMPAGASACYWQVDSNSAGNQVLVIEFQHLQHYTDGAGDNFNYQLRLYQNGNVSVHYGRMENQSSDTVYNFLMVAKGVDERVLLNGTWNSPSPLSPSSMGYTSGNNTVLTQYIYGIPDSSVKVTYVRPEPLCPRPTQLTLSWLSDNYATVSWNGNGVPGVTYHVEYDTMSYNEHGGSAYHNDMVAYDTFVNLSPLLPNKQYYVYVRSDCGNDSSNWMAFSFKTPCEPIGHAALPFTEDFQAYTTSMMQADIFNLGCWRRSGTSANVSYQNTPTTLRRLKMQASGNNNPLVVALPSMDNVGDLEVTFSVYYDNAGILEVGVLDNAGDFGSFVPVQSVSVPTNTWVERTVRLTGYSNGGNDIAFRLYHNGNTWSTAYLDDLNVHIAQGCPAVQEVNVDSVAATTAVVSWVDPNNVGNYQVTYYPTATPTLAGTVTATGLSATITGLTPDIDYTIEVAAMCGATASDTVSVTLHTICLPMALPYGESFEATAMPACWDVTALRFWNSSSTVYQPAICDTMAHSGTRSLMLTSRRPTNSSKDATWVVFPRTTAAPDRLMLDFSYRVPLWWENVELAVGITTTDADTTGFQRMFTIRPTDGQWHRYNLDFTLYTGTEGRIALLQINHSDRGYYASRPADYGFLDSVLVSEMANCTRPASVTCLNITSSSVTVSWVEPNNVGVYQVTCGTQTQTVSGATTCVFIGLTPQTTYTVGVQRICSGTPTDSRTTSFTTDCALESLPWSEDFETWADDGYDACWVRFASYSGQQCKASTLFHRSGSKALFVRSPKNYNTQSDQKVVAVLPRFNAPVDNLSIGFYVKDANGLFELGVVTDAQDSSTFVLVDTVVPGSGNWWYYEHNMTGYTGPQGRLALRYSCLGTNYKYTSVDDITVALAPSCNRPDSIVVDSTSLTTISVTIADHYAAGRYRLWWSDGVQTDSADFIGNSYTITGLTHSTRYSLEAATVCPTDSSLSLSCDKMAMTDCGIITHGDLPYTEGFDSGLPLCSRYLDYCYPNNSGDRTDASRYRGSSGKSLHPNVMHNNEPFFYVLPEMDSVQGVAVWFWAYNFRWQDNKIAVGVMTDPTDTLTFTEVQTVLPTVANQWEEHFVSLGTYSGTGRHVALRFGVRGTTFADQRWIDDISLVPDLACLPPDSVTVLALTDTSATLVVHDPRGVGHYRVVIGADTLDYTSDTIVLSGLTQATDYSVQVSSVCVDGAVTFHVGTAFTTECGVFALPWAEDFENQPRYNMPRCWELVSGGQYGANVSSYSYAQNGELVLSGSIRGDDIVMCVATPQIYIADTDLNMVFHLQLRQSYTDSNYHQHYLPVAVQVAWQTDSGTVELVSDTLESIESLSYTWYRFDFDTRAVPLGVGRLAFSIERNMTATSAYLYIDSIAITPIYHMPPCLAVDGLEVVDTSLSEATIVWVPQGVEEAWQLHLFNGMIDTLIGTDTAFVLLSNLSIATGYSVSVRPICINGAEIWSDTVVFVTATCPPVSDVSVAVTSSNTAVVGWQPAPDSHGPWRIEYGLAGFSQGEGYGITVNETYWSQEITVVIDSLESATAYDVYVATICGEGIHSVWSEAVSFTTWTDGVEHPIAEAERVSITPNPAHGSFSVNGVDGVVSVIVRDVAGRIVLNLQEVYPKQAISVAGLPRGAYYVTVIDATNTVTRKLIVK